MVTFYLGRMILILVDVHVINLICTHSYAFTFLLKLVFPQKKSSKNYSAVEAEVKPKSISSGMWITHGLLSHYSFHSSFIQIFWSVWTYKCVVVHASLRSINIQLKSKIQFSYFSWNFGNLITFPACNSFSNLNENSMKKQTNKNQKQTAPTIKPAWISNSENIDLGLKFHHFLFCVHKNQHS